MSTKKCRPSFDEKFVRTVLNFSASSRKQVTNKAVGGVIGVAESTIRKWRSEHPEFDNAFINAKFIWEDLVQNAVMDNLKPREKFTFIKDADGAKVIKEQILPTHQDLLAAQKLGLGKPLGGFEAQEKSRVIADIGKRYLSGKVDYLEALCECEVEGIEPPVTWKRRETARLVKSTEAGEITARQAVLEMQVAGLEVPPLIIMELKKELNLSGSETISELSRLIDEIGGGDGRQT